jgi:hypothetical protein
MNESFLRYQGFQLPSQAPYLAAWAVAGLAAGHALKSTFKEGSTRVERDGSTRMRQHQPE